MIERLQDGLGASTNACPSEEALSAWLDRRATAEERGQIKAHLSACSTCSELVRALKPGLGGRPLLAAALLIALASLALFTLFRPKDELELARAALEGGDQITAYALLASRAETADDRYPWPEVTALLAGPLESFEPQQFRRLQDSRSALYPSGVIATSRPAWILSAGQSPLELVIARAEGDALEALVTAEVQGDVTILRFPQDCPDLAPGAHEPRFHPPIGGGGQHGFQVARPTEALGVLLARVEAEIPDEDFGRLARAHAYLEAGFSGEALRELLSWSAPPEPVARWRDQLTERLCSRP